MTPARLARLLAKGHNTRDIPVPVDRMYTVGLGIGAALLLAALAITLFRVRRGRKTPMTGS